ncbi:MAG TPA: hypothetical protein VNV66_05200 [Pilimelia sp.]|nr:hypothetical protein [Pilimelia sp.]
MTVQAVQKPRPDTAKERTREEIARARRERDDAVRGEYEHLMNIAWAHHHAATAAILAASHAAGIGNDERRELIEQALGCLTRTRNWLDQAAYAVHDTSDDEPPF